MTNVEKRIFLIAIPILSLFYVFSPALFCLISHSVHGNRILFLGTDVRVPLGWLATSVEARHLTFVKCPVTIFGMHDAPTGFTIGQISAKTSHDPEELYKSWVSMNWSVWNGSNGVVKGPFPLGAGPKEIDCMTTFPNTAKSYGMASCLLFQRTWRAEFTGNKKDFETFSEVIRGASPVQKHSDE